VVRLDEKIYIQVTCNQKVIKIVAINETLKLAKVIRKSFCEATYPSL